MIFGNIVIKAKSQYNLIASIEQFIELNNLLIWEKNQQNQVLKYVISNWEKSIIKRFMKAYVIQVQREIIELNIRKIGIEDFEINFLVNGYGNYSAWDQEEPLNQLLDELSLRYKLINLNINLNQKLEEECNKRLQNLQYNLSKKIKVNKKPR